MDIQIMYSVPR